MNSDFHLSPFECQICNEEIEFISVLDNTCALRIKIQNEIKYKTILRGSRLCEKCWKILDSKLKSHRFITCRKCQCNYEYLDSYEQKIIETTCPICSYQFKQCQKHERSSQLFYQHTQKLPCYLCTKYQILEQLFLNIGFFMISPIIIFIFGIDGVEEWPCILQAFFFIFLPISVPLVVIFLIVSKFLAIIYYLYSLLQLWWSNKLQKKIWFK